MLDTYARLNGIDEEWIGVKYPGESKLSGKWIKYITDDFSRTEKVIYSDEKDIFDVLCSGKTVVPVIGTCCFESALQDIQ